MTHKHGGRAGGHDVHAMANERGDKYHVDAEIRDDVLEDVLIGQARGDGCLDRYRQGPIRDWCFGVNARVDPPGHSHGRFPVTDRLQNHIDVVVIRPAIGADPMRQPPPQSWDI